MAMVKCRECGNSISSEAAVCPFCGCPLKKLDSMNNTTNKNSAIVWKRIIKALIGLIILGLGLYLIKKSSRDIHGLNSAVTRVMLLLHL